MIRVNRRYKFSASHRLHVARFDERTNDELFGKCNNPFGHGHNYELEVTVRGEVDERTGRAVSVAELDRVVRDNVLDRYDHRNLNEELPEFAAAVATTENLGAEIFARLERAWPGTFGSGGPRLESIRIYETPRNIIKVSGTYQ